MSKSGSAFEREIAYKLSEWWTGSSDDPVFWRTSQSGGRATTRRKKGKKTSGQCGDICSTDPRSAVVTKLFTIECKRGYSSTSIGDVLDRPYKLKGKKGKNQTQIEKFLDQTLRAQENEGTPFWMLIVRRHHKKEFVYISYEFLRYLRIHGQMNPPYTPLPFLTASVNLRRGRKLVRVDMFGMKLDYFLAKVSPKVIKRTAKLCLNKNIM